MHDAGVDLSAQMDLASARRPGRAVQRVNVDFPADLLREIDQEARRLGVTRQAFIKIRLADTLQR
ncbi:MAG: CopG family transcriptional regulator [Acidobacteria bacterium]|nr:CopG family transcriptional regulator [Acidobacteriota bacterium]